MGVELRVHAFFPLLALVCLALSVKSGTGRGFGLFMVLVVAVVVRETARLLVAAWLGLRLRAVLLLPIGGLFAYANPESQEGAGQGSTQFFLAFTGPIANMATALVLAAAFVGAGGQMHLFDLPIITAAYLLRSMVWMQVAWRSSTCFPLIRSTWVASSAAVLPASTALRPPAALPPALARRLPCWPCWAAWRCRITGSSSPASSS
jgi:hypothetical protein